MLVGWRGSGGGGIELPLTYVKNRGVQNKIEVFIFRYKILYLKHDQLQLEK